MQITQKYNHFCIGHHEKGLERELKPASTLISFASNDYLGLRHHPQIKEAASRFSLEFGVGAGGSRLVDGNFAVHEELEAELAFAKGCESALLFGSGYQANMTALAALLDASVLGDKPLVFADKLNHASLHAGCQLAGVRQIRFRHLDMDHLDYCLSQYATSSRPKFVITETVFSMDGDITPIADLVSICEKYNAFLYVDEAHAFGMFGDKGYGFASQYKGQIPVVMGTLSKAAGCFGGYIACSAALKRYLLNRCGGVIYTTALPLPIAGAALEAVRLIPTMTWERAHVLALASHFAGRASSQIVPVLCDSAEDALQKQADLAEKGFFVPAIRPPTVPTSRLRFSFTASHTMADVERLCVDHTLS